MTTDTHLDGNALGALWHDLFGREMTAQRGCCDNCGNVAALATVTVFRDAPGDVVRCSRCESVLLVAVDTPSGLRVSWIGMRWVEV